jgi:hypothetical protein
MWLRWTKTSRTETRRTKGTRNLLAITINVCAKKNDARMKGCVDNTMEFVREDRGEGTYSAAVGEEEGKTGRRSGAVGIVSTHVQPFVVLAKQIPQM